MISKTVEFKKIKVRNFLSYGDEPTEIVFKNGITFVTGYNKDEESYNGVGKTSLIVESLSFLLFGETYRDINQKLIKNKFGGKTCIVEGWINVDGDELYIVRSLSPNKLLLTVNGDSDSYTKSVPETTKYIAERLGVSKTVLTNTIVMTNRESMSFLNQKKEAKVKFVEGILGLEAFAEFMKLAKEEAKKIDEDRAKKYQEVTMIERDLDSDKNYMENYEEKRKNDVQRLVERIESLKKLQPVDNSEKIESYKSAKGALEHDLPSKEDKYNRALQKKMELLAEKTQKERALRELSGKPKDCPTCKRPFEDHNHDEIENEKNVLKEFIQGLQEKITKFENALSKAGADIQKDKNTIRSLVNDISYLNDEQQKFYKSENEIISLQEQMISLQQAENPFKQKIDKSKDRLEDAQKSLVDLIQQSKIANLVKEGASPTGVKSLVIKKVIDALNNRINHYLVRLHSPFRIYFDEFFEESFSSVNGEEYCYGSLSGGEAKRVDFAMLFAFRDIRRLQSNIHVNLTVMDELFDSALCSKGMGDIMDLLKENTDECFMIVTHRGENVEIGGCDTIRLIKENKITRLTTDEDIFK